MGNFWKYSDRVAGGGVSGLTSANGGDAIGDNEIIRGDGTTGIQGGVLTSADHNGDISGPTASTDTTIAGLDFANQPSNDSITVVSSDAGDTAITVTLIGTTTGTDTVVVEDLALDGTDATTPVVSVKVNWGQLLAVKVTGTTAGTLTLTETSGGLTITTLAPAATSKGVDTGSISCWNRVPYVVASGASTKQIGLKGTNSAGATIYDSQALTGATSLLMNSAFVTVTEYYVGDLESTRTATITAQGGVGINDDLLLASGADIRWSTDTGLARSAAGVVKVTDGGAGNGLIWAANGIGVSANTYIADYSSNMKFIFNGGAPKVVLGNFGHAVLASDTALTWTSSGDATGTRDTGLARSAAGVVKVTDGGAGQGSLLVGLGTTGAPSIALGDGDTGLFESADDQLKIVTAGSSRLNIYNSSIEPQVGTYGGANESYGFKRSVEANTAGVGSPNVLGVGEFEKIFTNEGATAENYHTLPSAAAGYNFVFIVQDADGLRITANTGDTIRVIDKVTAAAGYISSTTIGSTVTLAAINGTEWVALSIKGVWTDGTFTYDDTGLTSP